VKTVRHILWRNRKQPPGEILRAVYHFGLLLSRLTGEDLFFGGKHMSAVAGAVGNHAALLGEYFHDFAADGAGSFFEYGSGVLGFATVDHHIFSSLRVVFVFASDLFIHCREEIETP
jgi:hypothetical protein